jgi:ribonuclease HI
MNDQQTIPFNASLPSVIITTDGACRPNPGPGAWACVLRFGTAYKELSGRSSGETTNNRMELQAIIEGLRLLKKPCRVIVRSDSKTAIAWCKGRSFRTETKQKKFSEAFAMHSEFKRMAQVHTISFEWVRGHNGDPDNERCDILANSLAGVS